MRMGRRDDPISIGVGVFCPLRHPCSPEELGRGRRPSRFSILQICQANQLGTKESWRWISLPSCVRPLQARAFLRSPCASSPIPTATLKAPCSFHIAAPTARVPSPCPRRESRSVVGLYTVRTRRTRRLEVSCFCIQEGSLLGSCPLPLLYCGIMRCTAVAEANKVKLHTTWLCAKCDRRARHGDRRQLGLSPCCEFVGCFRIMRCHGQQSTPGVITMAHHKTVYCVRVTGRTLLAENASSQTLLGCEHLHQSVPKHKVNSGKTSRPGNTMGSLDTWIRLPHRRCYLDICPG